VAAPAVQPRVRRADSVCARRIQRQNRARRARSVEEQLPGILLLSESV